MKYHLYIMKFQGCSYLAILSEFLSLNVVEKWVLGVDSGGRPESEGSEEGQSWVTEYTEEGNG